MTVLSRARRAVRQVIQAVRDSSSQGSHPLATVRLVGKFLSFTFIWPIYILSSLTPRCCSSRFSSQSASSSSTTPRSPTLSASWPKQLSTVAELDAEHFGSPAPSTSLFIDKAHAPHFLSGTSRFKCFLARMPFAHTLHQIFPVSGTMTIDKVHADHKGQREKQEV